MIKHNKPTIGIEEQLSAKRVLESEWLSPGENVRSFENEFSKYLGLENGSSICISSGSAAMYLILSVLGYKNKKIVIPSYTCVALKNAVELSEIVLNVLILKIIVSIYVPKSLMIQT